MWRSNDVEALGCLSDALRDEDCGVLPLEWALWARLRPARYLRVTDDRALLCQSAVGEGRVGRDDAALRMGRLRAAALRLRPKSETFKTVFRQAEGLLECTAETSRSINLASLASSGFTTFWCQKVAPKASARRKSRGTAAGLHLKRYADELAPAFLDGASDARSVSRFFAWRSLRCAARKQDDLFPQDTGWRIGLSYLRTEDCGARILRASAGGGFGPRGAKAPQCCGRMS